MVKRFLSIINKEIGGLHQAAYLLGAFAFLSQLLAFARDRLLAHSFGAGPTLDLYYASFRIPDFIFVTVASTVSLSVLIPLFVDRLGRGREEARAFLDNVFSFYFMVMAAVSALAFAAMPYIAPRIFPGLSDYGELASLSRLLLLSPLLLGLSNLFGSVAQAHKRFFLFALSPLLYNAGIIFGILFFRRAGIYGVVLGVVLGAFLHMATQVPFTWRKHLMPRFTFRLDRTEVQNVVGLSLPRTLALSAANLSTLFLLSAASLMSAGSIAIFNLAFNLQSVPLSIVGVSYSMAAFPTLARLFSSGNRDEFMAHIVTSARHIIFWSIPVTVVFIVLRAHIVRVILGSGEFGWGETRLTAAALGLFMLSAVFQGLMLLLVRGYYSAGLTKKPLLINVIGGAFSVAFSYALVRAFAEFDTWRLFVEALFRVEGIEGTEVLMLPLGYSLGMLVNGLVLCAFFERDFGGFVRPVAKTFFHSFSSSVIMGAAIYASLGVLDDLYETQTFMGIFLQGLSSGVVGAAVGVLLLVLMGNGEIREIWTALHKKFWKTKPVSPDPNVTA